MKTIAKHAIALGVMLCIGAVVFPKMEAADGTLIFSNKGTALAALTEQEFARRTGAYLIYKAEVEEIVKALTIMNKLNRPNLLVESVQYTSESARLRAAADKAERQEKDIEFAVSILSKWQKRASELKEAK